MKKSILSILIFCLSFILFADDKSKQADDKKSPFVFTGFLDTYYFGNLNNPKSHSNLGVSGFERAFDQKSGQFQVGMAQAKATYVGNKVDGIFDIALGNHADLANYGNTLSHLVGSTTSTALAIKQAYLTYKASDKISLTVGQFSTHIGYEVIDAPANYQYSLSNLFTNGPYYHTGIKANYSISPKFMLMGGIVNGIDSKDDNNNSLGLIGQMFLMPKDGFNVYLNWVGSNEGAESKSYYSLFDLVSTLQASPKLGLGINAALGTQDSKKWSGIALYSNYALQDNFGLGARIEHFDNKEGARSLLDSKGNGLSVTSFTVTGNVKVGDNLLLKPEIRHDAYSTAQIQDSNGALSKKTQTTLGVAAIFKF